MRKWLRRISPTFLTNASAAVLVLIAGVVIGHLKLPPQRLISDAVDAVEDLWKNGDMYFLGVPKKHLRPLRFDATGVEAAAPERMAPGVTFMTGLWGDVLGARLYASDGTLLYEWPVNFFEINAEKKSYAFDALIHGDHLYPNGDFVANLDKRGLVRVSASGEILWRNDNGSHHSIHIDDDGFIWTPIKGPKYNEPAISSIPFRFDKVAKFDPNTGEMLDEIDLVEVLMDAEAVGIVLANNPIYGDMMHLNDVEILSASMADAFPGFKAGDILLSSRHFNQLWVLDGTTHALKWWQTGPMMGQHDPDFQRDGTITLFDNRPGLSKPETDYLGTKYGSRILRIDPKTRQYETVYESDHRNRFYSAFRGKHQVLENGNILITETDAGRVFEITSDGEIVWSFVNGWDKTRVGWVMSATRYPSEYAAIGTVKCDD